MKIFISWSGIRSKHIADTFYWWLPHVIQACEPFVSQQNIEKGTRGVVTIAKNLEEANVGIICLTPEAVDKRWILFEAGALSKLTVAHVCTFLYELEWTDVKPPLGDFQHTKNTKEDIYKLMEDINSLLLAPIPPKRLGEALDLWYPQFEGRMANMPTQPDDDKPADIRTEASKTDEILELLRRLDANAERPRSPYYVYAKGEGIEALSRARGTPALAVEAVAKLFNSRSDIERHHITEFMRYLLFDNYGRVKYSEVADREGYQLAVLVGFVQNMVTADKDDPVVVVPTPHAQQFNWSKR